MFHTVIKILDSNVSLLLCLSTSFLFFSKDFLLSPFSMTSAHSTASHRVACWTTNVHPTLLQASTNWSLPSTSPTLHWLGCPGHSLPTMQWNDTRLDVFAAWVWATVISHPHLMSHAGHPCVTVLEKVAHQLDKKKKKALEDDGNLPYFLLSHLALSDICWWQLWWQIKCSWLSLVVLKPFYIFNNRQTNWTANMDLGHSSCEFLSAGTSGLLWPRPIPTVQFTPTSTFFPYRCEIWLLSEGCLCGNQQY